MNNAIRVLVVDDYPEFREWICSKLKTNVAFLSLARQQMEGKRFRRYAISFLTLFCSTSIFPIVTASMYSGNCAE